MGPPMAPWSRSICGFWALLSLAAALYLTLLPFEFRELSLERAWAIYSNMQMTGPGARGRQQFMSNVLMFLPLGFFLAAWVGYASRRSGVVIGTVFLVAAFGLLVTATVEFLQVWLPYRYPAGADILGNFTGALLGAVAWFALRRPLAHWLTVLGRSGPATLRLALAGYAVAYLLVGLVPFDLVLSTEELAQRLQSDAWGWWVAPGACREGLACGLGLGLEVLVSMPVGLLIGVWMLGNGRARVWAVVLVIPVAVSLELANLMTLSGIAEGRSVITRALGMVVGVALVGFLPSHPHGLIRWLQQWRISLLALGAPIYVFLLLAVNYEFGPYHLDLEMAAQRLADTRLLPFYYHYHVSEVAALRSVALHVLMYLPVGVLVWLMYLDRCPRWTGLARLAALTGALTALWVESGKLFLETGRPDSTSLVLAALAAAASAATLHWLVRASRPTYALESEAPSAPEAKPEWYSEPPDPGAGFAFSWNRWIASGLALVVLGIAAAWPVATGWLVLGLVAYAVALIRWPFAWLLVIPALIPLLDGSLYTGRLFVGELDLFLLMTVAGTLWHWRSPRQALDLPRVVSWPLGLLLVSTLVALVIAFWPWPAWEPGHMAHYATEWNALRVAKGLLWAVILLALLRGAPGTPREAIRRWFPAGVALGLLATILVVLRERVTYPGFLDFAHPYRISGWFTDMHVGGPSIETFLVLALPVALIWAWRQRAPLAWAATLVLALGALYAVAMTYSRGGYLGLLVGLAAVLLVGALMLLRGRTRRAGRGSAMAAVLLVAAGVLLPTLLGGVAEQRMSQVAEGLDARLAHWRLALDLPGGNALSPWIGRGLGQFPQAYRQAYPEGRVPANFAFADDSLHLGTGDSVYLNQRVALDRSQPYALGVRVRSDQGGRLGIYLCEKPIRHSFECVSAQISVSSGAEWKESHWTLDLSEMDTRPWPIRRGLVLSLAHAGGGPSVLEIDYVQLTDVAGREQLLNADFAAQGRHWYFTTDHLWPWRVENQWLEIYLDQGLLGLVAFVWLTLAALWLLLRRALRGDAFALGSLAGVLGALAVGVFGTIFFSPSVALLFYLVLLLGAVGSGQEASQGRIHHRGHGGHREGQGPGRGPIYHEAHEGTKEVKVKMGSP